jgi:cation transporter-like permease
MFTSITDIHAVSEAIRDAVAPVFLLTGIGSILGVLIGRLSRSIDRARLLNEMPIETRMSFHDELHIIVRRTKWLRRAIAFVTLAALCVCISIATMFVSVETGFKTPHIVAITFITAMCSMIIGLLCFLREIVLASREVIVPFKHEVN